MSTSIEEILSTLKTCESQKRMYNLMFQMYSNNLKKSEDLKYFKENDGPSLIISFLSKPNVKLLNISLGILAECCLDKDLCEDILSRGVFKSVTGIMKCINEDKTHYRCCKLIGNIVRYPRFCSSTISNGVIDSLKSVLSGNPSIATQTVIFRCLRYLWIGTDFKDKKIIAASKIFPTIAKCLSSDNKDMQVAVLQLILLISKVRYDLLLKDTITDDVLTELAKKTDNHSSVTLKIFYYLSDVKYLRFGMAKAGVIDILCSRIRNLNSECECGLCIKKEAEVEMDLTLRTLNGLCNEPKCREKLCYCPDAFDSLLSIVQNSSIVRFKKYAVLILTSFLYDESSLSLLVKQRLIFIFVKYLQLINFEQGRSHEKDGLKNDAVTLSCSPASSGRLSPTSDSELSFSNSPSPSYVRFTSSPASSADSIYSPVYSPAADDNDETDENEMMSIDDGCSVTESPLNILDDGDDFKLSADEKIFNLFKQVIHMKEPVYDLCAHCTWETLLDYLTSVRRTPSHIVSLLNAIAGNISFFNELLKSQFVLQVHKKLCRPIHVDCDYCQEMNKYGYEILARYQKVAESSYGHQILRDEITKKKITLPKLEIVLSIPLIVKNVQRLEEYLLRYKTLQLLMNSLNYENEENEHLFNDKIACLHSLANDIYLENPRIPFNLCKKCDVASLTKEATVTFLLDDGSTVTANKGIICEKSEFFEAMFRRGFKEAKESVVRLKDISSDCLTALFRLLYTYCDCILPKNVQVLLELIVQTDRFLIPCLSEKLLNIAMHCKLNYRNCHLMYEWAIEKGNFLPSTKDWPIREHILKYILVEKLTFKERTYSFKSLLKSRHKSSVLNDVTNLIESQLMCKDVQTKSSIQCFIRNFRQKS